MGSRTSLTELYNNKDVIEQIYALKDRIGGAVLTGIEASRESGLIKLVFTMENGETHTASFADGSVTEVTSSQAGDVVSLHFRFGDGTIQTVGFTVTATASAAFSSITGNATDNASLVAYVGGEVATVDGHVTAEKTRAEGIESGLQSRIDALTDTLVNILYPVGSLYFSTSAANPGTFIMGTTWQPYAEGRTLVGASAEYIGGAVGGEKEHTLQIEEMPTHAHSLSAHTHDLSGGNAAAAGQHSHSYTKQASGGMGYWSSGGGSNTESVQTGAAGTHTHTLEGTTGPAAGSTGSAGAGQAISLMQPYIVTYIFKRTA